MAASGSYIFFRMLLRILIGKKKRDELIRRDVINPSKCLHKLYIDRRYGFFKPLKIPRDHALIRPQEKLIVPIFDSWVVDEVRRVYLKPRSRNIVVDAGAHYGFYSIMCSKLVGPKGMVLAFEPERWNFAFLLANLKMNNTRNVKAYNFALGSVNGHVKLYRSEHTLGHSTVATSGNWSLVTVRRLDAVIEDVGPDRIDLIKIDVEGAELDVLKGAVGILRKFTPRLTIAAYHYPTEAQQLIQFIEVEAPFYEPKIRKVTVWDSQDKFLKEDSFLHCFPSRTGKTDIHLRSGSEPV